MKFVIIHGLLNENKSIQVYWIIRLKILKFTYSVTMPYGLERTLIQVNL